MSPPSLLLSVIPHSKNVLLQEDSIRGLTVEQKTDVTLRLSVISPSFYVRSEGLEMRLQPARFPN